MTKDHLHQYKKVNIGGYDYSTKPVSRRKVFVYACQSPECRHTSLPHLIAGKLAQCPRCKQPFNIPKEQIFKLMAQPHCNSCTKMSDKTKKIRETGIKLLEELGLDE